MAGFGCCILSLHPILVSTTALHTSPIERPESRFQASVVGPAYPYLSTPPQQKETVVSSSGSGVADHQEDFEWSGALSTPRDAASFDHLMLSLAASGGMNGTVSTLRNTKDVSEAAPAVLDGPSDTNKCRGDGRVEDPEADAWLEDIQEIIKEMRG